MTTPSRKLRHIAEASLTVFTEQIGVGKGQTPFFDGPACLKLKMTTPSRKLRHSAEASLTVFISERERGGGVQKNPYFNVL